MFTQRLKVFLPENAAENDRYLAELIDVIHAHPGSCDEVWLATAYGYPSLARHREIAAYQATLADRLRDAGIRVSMQIANTLGHGSYMVSCDCSGLAFEGSPARPMVGPDGEVSHLCFCWHGEYFINYYLEVMKAYAAIRPYRVWIDDDLRARNHKPVEHACFCEHCIEKFNRRYAHTFDRPTLVREINRGDVGVRAEWTEFIREGLSDFTETVVREFVTHSPDTLFALQNGANGFYTGYGLDFLLEPMHRVTKKPLGYRAGAGAYSDHDPTGFLEKARSIEYQNALLPPYVEDLRPEIECLPDVAYGKSPAGLAFETQLYFAYGATSMSYAMICREYEPLSDYHAREFAKFAQHRPYLERLSACNRRTQPSGVEFLVSRKAHLRSLDKDEPDFAYSDRKGFIGGIRPSLAIPVCYRTGDREGVYQLTESAATSLSDDEIRALLCRPVFADGKSLSILAARGFDDFGIEVHPVPTVAVREHFLPCPVNEHSAGKLWSQSYYDKQGFAFLPTGEGVMPVCEYQPTNASIPAPFPTHPRYPYGLSAVIVTTSGGGKWAIFGNNPWSATVSADRRNQLLRAIDLISEKRAVKAFLADPQQAIVRPRVTPDDKTACVSLVNVTVGETGEMTLVIRAPEHEHFSLQTAEVCIDSLDFERRNGDFLVKIPSLKAWSVATVFCE